MSNVHQEFQKANDTYAAKFPSEYKELPLPPGKKVLIGECFDYPLWDVNID